jgi:hypothetical protein
MVPVLCEKRALFERVRGGEVVERSKAKAAAAEEEEEEEEMEEEEEEACKAKASNVSSRSFRECEISRATTHNLDLRAIHC